VTPSRQLATALHPSVTFIHLSLDEQATYDYNPVLLTVSCIYDVKWGTLAWGSGWIGSLVEPVLSGHLMNCSFWQFRVSFVPQHRRLLLLVCRYHYRAARSFSCNEINNSFYEDLFLACDTRNYTKLTIDRKKKIKWRKEE